MEESFAWKSGKHVFMILWKPCTAKCVRSPMGISWPSTFHPKNFQSLLGTNGSGSGCLFTYTHNRFCSRERMVKTSNNKKSSKESEIRQEAKGKTRRQETPEPDEMRPETDQAGTRKGTQDKRTKTTERSYLINSEGRLIQFNSIQFFGREDV
jgi:hypothetical protein